MKITTIEISGFISCFNTLRKPFKKEPRSNIVQYTLPIESDTEYDLIFTERSCINKEDIKLLKKLIKAGDEHGKAVRLINVTAEIEAPLYWWNELCTYTVGVTSGCSESTMHTLKKEKLTKDDFEDYIDQVIIDHLQHYINNNEPIEIIKSLLPSGYLQKRDINFSYQTLARIYKQRKNHKLPQWHIFCEWIEKLPLAKSLIIGEE